MNILIKPFMILPEPVYNAVPYIYMVFGVLHISTGYVSCALLGCASIIHGCGVWFKRRGM
jgi:hypothetical protein